jgi:hypothetical protein
MSIYTSVISSLLSSDDPPADAGGVEPVGVGQHTNLASHVLLQADVVV